MNITLKQLQLFICITQEKTITAAAQKLFISKPAVSMGLAELEKQLGQKLFDRKNNRLLLNQWGMLLLPLADEQIERSKIITRLFEQQTSLTGKLRIGASNTIGNHVVPSLLSDFRAVTKHHKQSLLIANSTTICKQIKEYELDIGLVEAYVFDQQLQSIRWLKDDMVVVCNHAHPLAKKKILSLTDLENQEWILREAGSGTREFFIKNIGEKLTDYLVTLELNTTEAIINCTSVGLGITCISRLAARHALNDKRLIQLNLELDMSRDYWLVCHKDKYQSPLLKQLIEFSLDWQLPF
ncbi:LysR family transcriptional regulator [Psychromonas antarctica]|jgi:DNA-binding transcriptional LysR family regulator|uniref:LysR family transcriptional regulator n=1 Tax=Psychromonas antarctica TaxID=67573 RepID=UPI001EE90B42|nr:LysR family transcriptional regulator [Psychromonas antarctica]MCG6202003.1 LysR family transcriptional regulator [Psychromonas antarctica]